MQGPAELLHLSDDILLSIVEEAAGPSGPCPSGNNRYMPVKVAFVASFWESFIRAGKSPVVQTLRGSYGA